MYPLKKIAAAIALAIPVAAMAHDSKESKPNSKPESRSESRSESAALKEHIRLLEARLAKIEGASEQSKTIADKALQQADQASAVARKNAAELEKLNANNVDAAEFNRIRIKTEAQEDAAETSGFKNLKFSGYIDPSYIYNRNAKTSSFVFLNNNSPVNGSAESYGYDNTFFGSAMLNLEKELEGGSKFKFSLMPSKGTASGYNFGNLVHEATASVPLGTQSTRLIAGQFADWTGYEYTPATQNKLVTHNLLFDFSAGSFYTGAGLELSRGKWTSKILFANLNSARIDHASVKTPALTYRVDYAMNEFSGLGFSGIHAGFDDHIQFGRLDLVEVDGYFARGNWSFQGQIGLGRQGATPTNGYSADKASWIGLSTLASYKVLPQLEAIARFDFINNSKDGGGIFGATFGGVCKDRAGMDANCPDGRNGFGSGMVFDGSQWLVDDPSRGSNRSALALGLNYALLPGVNLKAEVRYDRSSARVFKDADAQYRRDNQVIVLSTVLSF